MEIDLESWRNDTGVLVPAGYDKMMFKIQTPTINFPFSYIYL